MFLFAKLMVRYLHKMATRDELLKNLGRGYFPEEIGKLHVNPSTDGRSYKLTAT